MRTRCLYLCLFLNLFTHAYSQKVAKGATIPDVPLLLHIGDSTSPVHLSDYKGKLILLDFWGVSCPDCIEAMPHMLEIQKQFPNQVQVIVVAVDKEPAIRDLFAKMQGHTTDKIIYAGSHLPFVMGDTILYKMFPHNGIPEHVWIDRTGVFRNITYGGTTTAENVQAFLDGKKVKLADAYMSTIDSEKPLTWVGGTANAEASVPSYSFFMSRMVNANYSGSREVDRDSATNSVVGLAMTNKTILEIYMEVFALKNRIKHMSESDVILEVPDREKYLWPKEESKVFGWADSNTYCYAIKVPLADSGSVTEKMHQDLDRFFHLQSSMQQRQVRCLALKRISSDDKLAVEEKGAKAGIHVDKNGKLWFTIKNEDIFELFYRVHDVAYFSDRFTPVYDETNYKGNVNITIPFTEDAYGVSVEEMRQTLRKYGLDLVEEYRTLNMLVIRDNSAGTTALAK